MNKNHEGYHDPTACEAVRRVRRFKRKRKGVVKCDSLVYRLDEVPGFNQVKNLLLR